MEYLSVRRAADRLVTPQQIAERIALFTERITPMGVEVHRVETVGDARGVIQQLAEAIGAEIALISAELERVYDSAFLETAEGCSQRFEVAIDPAASRDAPLGVTLAKRAIAETGSVVLSEPDLADRSVGLLSLVLVVIVPTGAILARLDEVAPFLREQARRPGGAYTTLLTGPSRTADIEMSLTVGVQGPGRVVVIFVDEEPDE
ncbi:MAG: LUD domain-containing protein [Thermomicrobiales bacterium]|nr:LUD domain-containing protein [Thermomicrobiales bacterium]